MVKVYMIIVLLIFTIFMAFGFLGPMLISAKSNYAFWLGIFVLIVWPIVAGKIAINLYRRGRKHYEKTMSGIRNRDDNVDGVYAKSPGGECGDSGETVR
jgi:hypothetical protein